MNWKSNSGLLVVASFLIMFACTKDSLPGPVVTDPKPSTSIEGGKIQGKWISKGQIASFKGIPYAAPPVGTLRWKAPQPVEAWEGILKTTAFRYSACQQEITLPLFLEALINGQGYEGAEND